MWVLDEPTMLLIFHKCMRFLFIQNYGGHGRVAKVGSHSARAKMATKIFRHARICDSRNKCVVLRVNAKGWLPIAKLKPLVERYSCHPMRSLDTSNNLSVGPSCMWRTWNSWLCYLVSNTAGRRPGWEEQRDREKQGERGRAGEEQWKGRGKLLNLVIQVTGVE